MSSILTSKKFQETTFDLPVALGKTITNEVFMVDRPKRPTCWWPVRQVKVSLWD